MSRPVVNHINIFEENNKQHTTSFVDNMEINTFLQCEKLFQLCKPQKNNKKKKKK